MTARNQNFEMNKGETKKIVVDQTDDEDNGGDLDFSGYQELRWVIKDYRGDGIIVEKTEGGSTDVVVTDATTGAYEITISPTDTEGLTSYPNELYHRVRLVDSSGNESDLLEGYISVYDN